MRQNRGRSTPLNLGQDLSQPKVLHQMGFKDFKKFLKNPADAVKNKIVEDAYKDGKKFITEKMHEVYSKIKDLLPAGVNEFKAQSILISTISIVHDITDSRFVNNIGNHVVQMLSTLELISGECFLLATAITNYFRFVLDKMYRKKDPGVNINLNLNSKAIQHQMLDGYEAPIASLIVVIAGIFNVVIHKNERIPNFFSMRKIKEFANTSNSMHIFVKNHLEQLTSCFEWFHAKVNKVQFERVIVDQPEELQEFLREASMFVHDPSMYQNIVNSTKLQYKVFRLILQANKISSITACNTRKTQLHSTVRGILSKLGDLQERLINDCITPNVGYEPWVLQLAGPPGTGKTTIVNQLVPRLLKAINYRVINEMVFIRSIGTDFWNGVCNQPFILYDDMFVEENSAPIQLAEWMQLKSSVSFNPNCAHLEDKKRRISPIGLIINSNKAYYGSELSFMYTPDAINRRRDMLWYVDLDIDQMKDEATKVQLRQQKMKEMADVRVREGKTSYSEYRFYKAINPRVQINETNMLANFGQPMLFEEFVTECISDFVRYRRQELIAYEERFKLLTAADDNEKLLTPDELDDEISKRVQKYIKRIESEDVNSFMNVMRRVVDSGRSSIFGKDAENADVINPLKTLEEKIELLQKVALSEKKSEFDQSKRVQQEIITGSIKHQMEEPEVNVIMPELNVEQNAGVVLIDQGPQSLISRTMANSEVGLSYDTQTETFEEMAGHWYLHETIKWSSTSTYYDSLYGGALPAVLFNVGQFKNSLNSSIFRGYRFYSFDMDIKVVVNASRMEYGCLLVAWQYKDKNWINDDFGFSTVTSLIQGPHEFIYASSNTIANFKIPYKYIWPMLIMKDGFDIDSFCNLYIRVMNPLCSYDSATTDCNVSIFFKFSNIRKAGLYYNLGIRHQMLETMLAATAAEGVRYLFRKIRPDKNRDNPTTLENANPIVLRNTASWCHGTNSVDTSNILRLDPTGTCVHYDSSDEMNALSIARIYGLQSILNWSTSDATGSQLFSVAVNPMAGMFKNSNVFNKMDAVNRKLATYNSHPLGVISSIYSYWRGSIDYKFVFICPFMVSGRVYVCFIPCGNQRLDDVSFYDFEKCKSFYGTYFDLGEVTSFTFNVPFISGMPWLDVTPGEKNSKLGYVKLFVVNKLKCGSIRTSINFNVFIKAGDDYQLAVPSLPRVAPSFHRDYLFETDTYLPSQLEVFFKKSSLEFVTSTPETLYFPFAKDKNSTVSSLIPIIKETAMFMADREFEWYYYSDTSAKTWTNKTRYVLGWKYREDKTKQNWIYTFSPIPSLHDNIESEQVWKVINWCNLEKNKKYGLDELFPNESKFKEIGVNFSDVINMIPVKDSLEGSSGDLRFLLVKHPVEHQMGEDLIKPIVAQAPRYDSMDFFCETFIDLKDMTRRYQFYCDFLMKIDKKLPIGKVLVRIPISVSGIYPDMTSKSTKEKEVLVYNHQRTGLIPLIASGFRFFKGSLRLKLVFPNIRVAVSTTFVHDRDIMMKVEASKGSDAYAYALNGYSYFVQNLVTNPIMEIEIPYYKKMPYLWSNRVKQDKSHRHALGYLDVSIVSQIDDDKEIPVQVFMALGDDARFSSFQGFPAVIDIAEIPQSAPYIPTRSVDDDYEIVHQMGLFTRHQTSEVPLPKASDDKEKEISEEEKQQALDKILLNIDLPKSETVCEVVDSIVNKDQMTIDQALNVLQKAKETIENSQSEQLIKEIEQRNLKDDFEHFLEDDEKYTKYMNNQDRASIKITEIRKKDELSIFEKDILYFSFANSMLPRFREKNLLSTIKRICDDVHGKCEHSLIFEKVPTEWFYGPYNGKMILYDSNGDIKDGVSCDSCERKNLCAFKTRTGREFIQNWIRKNFYSDSVINSNSIPPLFRDEASVYIPGPLGKEYNIISLEEERNMYKINEEDKKEAKTFLEKTREKCKKWFTISMLKKIVKWVGIGLMILGAAFGISKGYQYYKNPNMEHETAESEYASTHYDRRTNMKLRSVFGKSSARKADSYLKHQISGNLEDMVTLVKKNCYMCVLYVNNNCVGSCKVLALKGHLFLGIKHFFDKAKANCIGKNDVEIHLKRQRICHKIKYRYINIIEADNSSLVLFKVPKDTMALHRDITKHIASENDHKYLPTRCIIYDFLGEDAERHTLNVSPQDSITIPAYNDFEQVVLPSCYTYNFGYQGACGALLIGTEGSPKIFGVHVAGIDPKKFESKRGYSEPMTLESIPDEIIEAEHQMLYETIEGIDDTLEFFRPAVQIPDNVYVVGTISKELAVHGPNTSEKVPTTIQSEIFKTTVVPPPLRKFGDKDPLAIAISKYAQVPKVFDPIILDDCTKDLSEAILCYCRPLFVTKRQWLTDQEIFGGIPDHSSYASINLLSSEGYPLCIMRIHDKEMYTYFASKGKDMKGKNWLFDYTLGDKGRILHQIHPALQEIMETNHALRAEGTQPLSIFISTLKDQCIPIEKAKDFRVRVFSNSSIQDTWQTKKYFGHWQAAYTAARFSNESAIGINAESFEWTDLFKRLVQKGSNIITGDYKAFGDTLARDCMWKAYEIIEEWYKYHYGNEDEYEECRQQRYMLFESMCSSPHMARNVLFRKIAGIPSGFALTVEINDLVNKLYLRYVFIKLTGRPLTDFRRFTYLCTYGDDMIWSINNILKEEITFQKVQECFSELEITFTPASKDGVVYDFLSIYEATFLKGRFVPHPFRQGVMLRHMPLASCLECLNWKNKSVPEDCYLYSAFRVCLRYLHAYGPDVYNQYRQRMLKVVIDYSDIIFPADFKPDLPTWRKIDEELFGHR